MTHIRFGTDGWRAVIAEDFTFENVRKVVQAVCDYVHELGKGERGIVIGYDMRFLSPEFAAAAAEVVTGNDMPVWLVDRFSPTPAVSLAVVRKEAALGLMITASHNPSTHNGIKIKADYGGSATEAITGRVEAILYANEAAGKNPLVHPLSEGLARGQIRYFNPDDDYFPQIERLIERNVLEKRPLKVVADSMYGAGSGYLKHFLGSLGWEVIEIRAERNPAFPGINPEPIPANLAMTMASVREHGAAMGLITDGDADRIGVVDGNGHYVDAQRIFALLLQHLVEDRGWTGSVVKTFAVTEMVDRLARQYGLTLHERPIGFKHVCELALTEDVLIGGEESGGIGVKNHIPERDGILCCLLIAEMVAQRGKPLQQLVEELLEQVGPHYYRRVDLKLAAGRKERLLVELQGDLPSTIAGLPVREVDRLDGVKFLLGDGATSHGWLLIRPSGTEPIVRVYAEMNTPELLEQVLGAGERLAKGE